MTYQTSTYTGDAEFSINCTGDAVTGDTVRFERATFTGGSTTRIKGRNLYKQGVWRKPWADESARDHAAIEKHRRGEYARSVRDARRIEGGLS